MLLLSNQTPIKKCANCNKYFIPEARENEIYCDRVHDNGKTCKQLGWTKKEKAKEYKEYRKTYIAFKAFLKRNEDKYNSYECKTSLKQIFNTWNEIAKDKKEKLNPRILSYSEYKKQVEKYITWIDNSYDKIKELLNDTGDYATFAYICDLDEEGVRAWLAKL
jgi:vacuolar-type H+-ATPase subunit I/STV1